MGFRDLCQRPRQVEHRGKAYTVRPPSIATVATFVSLYGAALETVIEATREHGLPADADLRRMLGALLLASPERARSVVETCVDGPPDDLGPFVEAMLALVSPVGLVEFATEQVPASAVKPGGTDGGAADGLTLLCVGLAERFHVSPLEIAYWPVHAVVELLGAARRPQDERQPMSPLAAPPMQGFGVFAVKKRPLPN